MKRLLILFTFLTLIAGQALAQQGVPENTVAKCNDNLDNDGNGLVDCRDPACTGLKPQGCENPTDGIDNDGDNFIDCYDKETAFNNECDGFFLGTLDSCSALPGLFDPFQMKLKYASPVNTANHINRLIVGDVDSDGKPEIVTTYRNADNAGKNTSESRINILSANGTPTLGVEKSIDLFSKNQFVTFEDIAMADINKDGCAEYFVLLSDYDGNNYRTVAYDCNGNEIWATPITYSTYPGTAGLADFDHDGMVELYFRTQVYDAHTGKLMGENNADNDNVTPINNGVNKGRGMNTSQSLAIDMDAPLGITNNNLELIAGCRIYTVTINRGALTATITMAKQRTEYATRTGRTTGSSTSIADFDQDGFLDVLAVGSLGAYDANTTIFFWDVKNDQLKTYSDQFTFLELDPTTPAPNDTRTNTNYQFGWKNGAGRINIADIDGDTLMNAVYVSGKFLYALKETNSGTGLDTLWREPVMEETSGYTGCTMFDFNADGKSEIVYRDEDNIYIFTTETNGNVIRSSPVACASRTSNEYPIVADMDGDGSTEICVACAVGGPANGGAHALYDAAQVRIYQSGTSTPWVPARKVWNQHGYFVVNVKDDLTIPQNQQLHHLTYEKNVDCRGDGKPKSTKPLNSFLNQSPFLDNYGCPSFATPNLSWTKFDPTDGDTIKVSAGQCPNKLLDIDFTFKNRGDIGITGNLPVSFYDKDPRKPGATRLGTTYINLNNMLPGTYKTHHVEDLVGPGSPFTLFVVLNDAGTTVPTPIKLPNSGIVECDYGDNVVDVEVEPALGDVEAANVRNSFACNGIDSEDGAVKAWVWLDAAKTQKDSTNFDFYWSDGIVTKPLGSEDHIGYLYNQLAVGQYNVYAVHKTIACQTDTAIAPVNPRPNTINAVITIDHKNENCKNPNGAMHVEVFVNGSAIPEPTGKYTYKWFDANRPDVIGVSHQLSGVPEGNYSVQVIDKASGCDDFATETLLPDHPPMNLVTATVDVSCSNLPTGQASVTVNGGTNGFNYSWYNGKNVKPTPDQPNPRGPIYQNLAGGFYTVLVEDNNTKCTAQATVEVKQTSKPAFDVTPVDHLGCTPSPGTGSATVSNITNVVTLQVNWYKGQNTLAGNKIGSGTSISGLLPGIYTVMVRDVSTNCNTTKEFTILNKSGVTTLVPTVQHVTQCLPINGSITVLPQVGLPTDYTYTWYQGAIAVPSKIIPGETGNALLNRKAGYYTVNAVSNVSGCQLTDVTARILDQTPTISINIDPATIVSPIDCQSSIGEVGATISFSTPATFNVTWSADLVEDVPPIDRAFVVRTSPQFVNVTNAADQVSGLRSGYYTIDVLTDGGCKATKIYFLKAKTTDTMTVVLNHVTMCPNPSAGTGVNGSITATLDPSNTGATENDYRFELWKIGGATFEQAIDGNAKLPDDNIFFFPGLDTGNYFVRAIDVTGVLCDFFSDVVEIKDNRVQPLVDLTPTGNTICVGTPNGAVNVTSTTGVAPFTFEYFRGNANTTNSIVGAGMTVNNLSSDYYTVRMTDDRGCIAQKSAFVPQDLAIIVADALATPRLDCATPDGLVQVSTVNELYANQPIPTPSPYSDPTYSISWFSTTLAGTVIPFVDPSPVVSESMIDALDTGNYYFEIVNVTTQCKTEKVLGKVEEGRVKPLVNLLSFLTPTSCLSEDFPVGDPDHDAITGQRYGFLTVSAEPAGGNFTYAWTSPSGDPIGTPASPTIRTLFDGTYRVLVTNDDNHCEQPEVYTLDIIPFPVVVATSFGPETHCINPDGILSASVTSGVNAHYNFFWDGPQDYNTDYVDDVVSGTYQLTVTDNRAGNGACSTTATVVVPEEKPTITVEATPTQPVSVCVDTPSKQDGSAIAIPNDDPLDFNYGWFEGVKTLTDGRVDTLANGHGALINGLGVKTYTVVVRHVPSGCDALDDVSIVRDPLPTPLPNLDILSHVTNCEPYDEDIDFPADGKPDHPANGSLEAYVPDPNMIPPKNTTDYLFKWSYTGAYDPLIDTDRDTIVFARDTIPPGTYTITVIDRHTRCESLPVSQTIEPRPVNPAFTLDMLPAVCNTGTGFVYLTLTNDVQIDTITWSVEAPSHNDYEADGVAVRDAAAGTYTALVIGVNGCSATGSIVLKTEINPYNGISRNGDGMNDYFHIGCIEEFPYNVVKIYNRAGTLVFEGNNYNNSEVLFEGYSNKGISPMGTNLPDGTYFYVIDKRDGSKPVAGYLEIVN